MQFKDFQTNPPQQPVFHTVADTTHLQNRRNQQRAVGHGEILIGWYHEHDQPRAYCALDISENGARISTDCYLPDGLTGIALVHQPTGIRIDRPCMVAWCKAVRDIVGRLEHHEAGIRFF